MSKQPANNKGGGDARRMGGQPTQPGNKQSNTVASTGARAQNVTRPGAVPRPGPAKTGYSAGKKKARFRLRPLDVGLVIAGILIVGFIVFSAFQSPPVQVNAGVGVPATATHVPVGQAAPAFTVQDTSGNLVTLDTFKGKVLVVEYMATWCPHCQAEVPTYNQVYDTYVSAGKPVAMIGINATPYGHDHSSPANTSDLSWFKDNYHSEYPLYFDKALQSANDYGVIAYPSTYVIDQTGKVAYQPPDTALPTYDEIAAKIDELLKK